MNNISYMAGSYALVGILIIGYVGVLHHRINYLWSIVEEENTSENQKDDDKMQDEVGE